MLSGTNGLKNPQSAIRNVESGTLKMVKYPELATRNYSASQSAIRNPQVEF